MNHYSGSKTGLQEQRSAGLKTAVEPSQHVSRESGRQLAERRFRQNHGVVAKWAGRMLQRLGDLPLRLELPNGEAVEGTSERLPVATVTIHDYRTLLALIADPVFQFGEAYTAGAIDFDGDLRESLVEVYRRMKQRALPSWSERILPHLHPPRTNSLNGSQENIHHHYDLGNDFYRQWLDERMQYTCAYFAKPEFTLEQAQRAKLDHVCRKLRLRPGMEVVEAGCGWGGLALYMAEHYGVHVRAYNISAEQVAWANAAVRRNGLVDRVEFVRDDWRNISGQYDAFVSVGMLEHVGRKNYQLLGRTIQDCLKPDGMGLIHTIGQNTPQPMNAWIEKRIFPGAYPPTLKQMMEIFEGPDFSILDVENLRLHYAETLRHWLARFENASRAIGDTFDESFVRMWRLYLAGSAASFETGFLQLYQVVFAPGQSNQIPRTREHLHDTANARFASAIRGQS